MTLDDVRECPATYTLAASWVLVFALMHLAQRDQDIPPRVSSQIGPGAIVTTTSHRFGDMTWAEVRRGEVWRALTATFIHYSLIHLGLNLLGLIKLGRLIEPWYGGGPFLAACLAIGGLGNLLGGALRQGLDWSKEWAASTPLARAWPGLFDRLAPGGPMTDNIHSGGGSTVLLGLIGLCAVVGWRSRTRIGTFLRDQMVAILAFTGLLGLLLPNLVDNFGHAGGAIAGLAVGFVHRHLIRLGERKTFRRGALAVASALAVACLMAAVRDDRAETTLAAEVGQARGRFQLDSRLLQELERLYVLFGRSIFLDPAYREPGLELDVRAIVDLFSRGPSLASQAKDAAPEAEQAARDKLELAALLARLDGLPESTAAALYGGPVAADIARLRDLGRGAVAGPPGFGQAYEFIVAWTAASRAIAADRARAQGRLIELDRQAVRAL